MSKKKKDLFNAITSRRSYPTDTMGLFRRALHKVGLKGLAERIGLHPNTIRRWVDTRNIPDPYAPDFKRVLGIPATDDIPPDQYFTRPETAQKCFEVFLEVLKELKVNPKKYVFIEPSMGEGSFFDTLPENRRIGIDISPCRSETLQADYLLWQPDKDSKYLVIGNPPFGLRGHLALQFINHSYKFADVVGFILPQLFGSDGKGVPGKRVKGYRLAYNEDLRGDLFVDPDGKTMRINTVFQVWTKVGLKYLPAPDQSTCKRYITIYSLSDGGTPASTRNRHMIGNCDVYLPSTTFSGMCAYERFEDLPNQRGYGVVIHQKKNAILSLIFDHDWNTTAFPSTNSAMNLRRSMIEEVVKTGGYIDLKKKKKKKRDMKEKGLKFKSFDFCGMSY